MLDIQPYMHVTEFRLKLYPKNFETARDFYEHVLKFHVVHEWNDGEGGAEDQGVMFAVGNTILELLSGHDDDMRGADISLEVENAPALWEDFKLYPHIVHALRTNSWGDVSFSIADPEGFRITFFTKI